MMGEFINWCMVHDNMFISCFAFLSFLLSLLIIVGLFITLLIAQPILGILAFLGVWYLIWKKHKKETKQ